MTKNIPSQYTKANTPQLRTRADLRANPFVVVADDLNFLFAHGGTRCGGQVFDPPWESTDITFSQDPTGSGRSFAFYTPVGRFDRYLSNEVVKIGVATFGVEYEMNIQVRKASDLSTVKSVNFTDADPTQESWTTGIVTIDKADATDGSGNPILLYLFLRGSAIATGDTARIFQYEAGSLVLDDPNDLPPRTPDKVLLQASASLSSTASVTRELQTSMSASLTVYPSVQNPDTAVYSASIDDTARKINHDNTEAWSFTGHTDDVQEIAVDPDGNVYTASFDDTLRKLDSFGNEIWSFTGHTDTVACVAVDADGNVYSGSSDGTVRKLDSDGNQIWSFTNHNSIAAGIAVDTSGNVYLASLDDTVRKLNSSGSQIWDFDGHMDDVLEVAVDLDGNVYTASWDDTVRKLDSLGNQIWSFTGHTDRVYAVDIDQDGNVYSASQDQTVRKLDSSGTEIWSFTGHTASVEGVAVDPSGRVYSASADGTVRKIDSDGNEIWSFTGHTSGLLGVAVDPGKYGAFPNEW